MVYVLKSHLGKPEFGDFGIWDFGESKIRSAVKKQRKKLFDEIQKYSLKYRDDFR